MTDYPTITHWRATRSGAALTVKGSDQGGRPIKISGIRFIEPTAIEGRAVKAVTADGDTYLLKV